MPNIKSAKKRVLVNQTKLAQNKAARSALKTAVKKFDSAVQAGDAAAAQEVYRQTVKTVDQAASNGIIPKNRASHIKSKMTLKLNKISA
ncbi:MAG: 30S ribosomal protein S20 [Clostridia bacterium]|nr:30S ribosomal protein S20 [Clostridia bacterium]